MSEVHTCRFSQSGGEALARHAARGVRSTSPAASIAFGAAAASSASDAGARPSDGSAASKVPLQGFLIWHWSRRTSIGRRHRAVLIRRRRLHVQNRHWSAAVVTQRGEVRLGVPAGGARQVAGEGRSPLLQFAVGRNGGAPGGRPAGKLRRAGAADCFATVVRRLVRFEFCLDLLQSWTAHARWSVNSTVFIFPIYSEKTELEPEKETKA